MNDTGKFFLLVFLNISLVLGLVTIAIPSVFPPQEKLWAPAKIDGLAASQPQCIDGVNASCTVGGGCQGKAVCRNGKWSICTISKVCTPGSRVGCFEDSCGMGYATCNPCGTGYENCTSAPSN